MIVYTLQRLHNFTHRLVISLLAKRLREPPFYPTYTSFGAWPGDHHIFFHSVFQPAKYSH
jgi:hypothetical protein